MEIYNIIKAKPSDNIYTVIVETNSGPVYKQVPDTGVILITPVEPKELTSEDIINSINEGNDYHTRNENGSLTKVIIKEGIERGPYLTTIKDDGTENNLDNLPLI